MGLSTVVLPADRQHAGPPRDRFTSELSSVPRPVARIPLELTTPPKSRPKGPVELLPEFLAGPENQLIAYVLQHDAPLIERGNPLLLFGSGGSGKSALARLFAQRELQRTERRRLLVEPAAEFARRYAEAIESDDLDHFRSRYRRAEVWVIEDLQGIAAKTAAQDELAHRLDARLAEAGPVIAVSRRLPTEQRNLRPGLASRLLPGLTIPVELPGPETRRALVADLAAQHQLPIAADLVNHLSDALPAALPARRLAGIIQYLVALRDESGGAVDPWLVAQAVEAATVTAEPSIGAIAQAVARRFKLKASDLKSATRRQQVVRARGLAMLLGRRMTDSSLQEIGRYFGGRDHTTVMHACRKTERMLDESHELARAADEVVEQLRVG